MIKRYWKPFIFLFSFNIAYAFLISGLSFFAFNFYYSQNYGSQQILVQNILMPWGITLSFVFNLICCYLLAKAKGYSGWWCLLSIATILGYLVLFLLPNKAKVK